MIACQTNRFPCTIETGVARQPYINIWNSLGSKIGYLMLKYQSHEVVPCYDRYTESQT